MLNGGKRETADTKHHHKLKGKQKCKECNDENLFLLTTKFSRSLNHYTNLHIPKTKTPFISKQTEIGRYLTFSSKSRNWGE